MESTERKLPIRPAPAHFENHDLSVVRRRVMELPGVPVRAGRRLREQWVKIAHQIFSISFIFGDETTELFVDGGRIGADRTAQSEKPTHQRDQPEIGKGLIADLIVGADFLREERILDDFHV